MFNETRYLPDAWLIEIGRITQAWASFEQFFNLMLQKLAGYDEPFDPTFTILVAHASMPQRLYMFAYLCADLVDSQPESNSHKEVLGLVKEAQSVRNKFSHNLISLDESDGNRAKIANVSARGKLKQELVPIALEDLRAASDKIISAMHAIYCLVLNPSGQKMT